MSPRPIAVRREHYLAEKLAGFRARHGFAPDLETPRRFSEKMLRRILSDDDPRYHLYATKLRAPDFCRERSIPDLHFARRYKVVRRLAPGDFHDLPTGFVLKASFGSGLNRIVTDKSALNLRKVCAWFNDRLPSKFNARGQTDPDNCVIVEELLLDRNGAIPTDYKLHCFRQPTGDYRVIVQLDSDRFGQHRQSFLDEHFAPLDLSFGVAPAHEIAPAAPENLDTLLRVGRALARGFDYIRIDLYCIDSRVYFGEITPFHKGGTSKPEPDHWDLRLGALWTQTLPALTVA